MPPRWRLTRWEQFIPWLQVGRGPTRLSPRGFAEMDALARRRDIAQRIRGTLMRLNADDRAAFVLRIIEELPVNEVAAILEIPDPLVRQRVHRACLMVSGYIRHLASDGSAAAINVEQR
jgi:DNA-directed RNA polymerase specialized sigma24 family protein